MTLAQLYDLLFRQPPSPPAQLQIARRETMRDAVRALQAARDFQSAVDEQHNILDRLGDIRHLIREGDGDGQ